MCSIWLVVLVAANRYWAVCRPHDAAGVWTARRTIGYVSVVVVGVVAFNVPRVLEYRIETVAVISSTSLVLDSTVASPSANTATNPVDHYHSAAHIETETRNETETEWKLREVTTEFGQSVFYRYVYKVLFVNILLVLLPLVTLVVLSVFVVRALRRTSSYRLSLLHPQARLSDKRALPAEVPPAADEVIKDEDDAVADDEGQRQQQQQRQLMYDYPANDRAECDEDVKTRKSRSKFSLKSLRVRDASVFTKLLPNSTTRTPATDMLYNTTNGQAHNVLPIVVQQICNIAMSERNVSTCQDVGMWQIFVRWW